MAHYKKDGSLDMRYSSSRAAVASSSYSSSSSSYSSQGRSSYGSSYASGSGNSLHYKKDGNLDMRYASSKAAMASAASPFGGGGGGGGVSSFGFAPSATAVPPPAPANQSLHYKKDGTLDMRYTSSQAAARPPSAAKLGTATDGLHYKKDGSLDMRYKSSQEIAGMQLQADQRDLARHGAVSTSASRSNVSGDTQRGGEQLHFKKDGTLDMRYKSSQEVVAKQMQQLDIAENAKSKRTAAIKRPTGIPPFVPLTKSGRPDLRTRAAKDWILAEAKTWNDTVPLPAWIPRLKDGSPDTTKSITRTFFRSATAPPPPRRDEYYAERLMDEMFQRLVAQERKRVVPRLIAPEYVQNTAGMRAALKQIHESIGGDNAATPAAAGDTQHGLPSSVRQLDYARDLVVKETDAPLGHGSFGAVLRGSWNGKPVAIKRLHAAQLTKRDRKMFANETLVLCMLGAHPNIVQLFGYTLAPPALVMEFVPRGSLSFVLHYCEDPEVEAVITDGRVKLNLLLGIAYGMAQLHACGVTHGDLKPQNVLVSEDYEAKIADFGLATLRAKTSSSMSSHMLVRNGSSGRAGSPSTTAGVDGGDEVGERNDEDVDQEGAACGTAAYMAPELLNPLEISNEKTDVYSFGILMNELLHEEEPYYESLRQFVGKGPFAAVLAAMSGQRPAMSERKVTPELKLLIEQCWSERASKRPTFEQIAARLAACSGIPNSCA